MTSAVPVAIYRQRLFVPSETFISQQAHSLERYAPTFVARRPVTDAPVWAATRSTAGEDGPVADLALAASGRSASLGRILREIGPRLTHAHFGPDGLVCSRAVAALDVPLVVTLHGRDVTVSRRTLVRTARPVALRYAWQRRSLGERAARILCVSRFIRERAAAAGIAEDALDVHYIGVDTERFAAAPWPRPPLVVHVGRLVEKKGTEVLLRAMATVVRCAADARLVVVGDGPRRTHLAELITRLGLSEHVELTGRLPVDDVAALLRRARVVAVPSVTAADGDAEGLPVALLEAMSTGCAIVATRHAGLPEAVTDGKEGLLVAERDVGALADALVHLVGDEAAAARAGAAAARRIRRDFDLRTQTRQLEAHYDAVIR